MEQTLIPVPLQGQILLRLALAVCSLIVGSIFLILFTVTIAIPFFLQALLTAVSGGYLYWLALCGRYLILTGTVLNVERTAILHRSKAILIEVEGKVLRVILRSSYKTPSIGSRILFYVQDSTPIYEWRGIHLLGTYLAVSAGKSA